jgi:phenylalanyl-tRNA synthetase beta subunit
MKLPLSQVRALVPSYAGTVDELRDLLTFSGTEVEGVEERAGDVILECAVTSNRTDCLGWIGLARDVGAAHLRSREDRSRGRGLLSAVCRPRD